MKKRIIEAMIDSINNIDYEIFKFEQLVKCCEENCPTYVRELYHIRYGTMFELEEEIRALRKELKKILIKNMSIKKADVEA